MVRAAMKTKSYLVGGEIRRSDTVTSFNWSVPHHGMGFQGYSFYQRLFP
jgi:hypothetical protein